MQKKQLMGLDGPIDNRGNKLYYSMKLKDSIIVIDVNGVIYVCFPLTFFIPFQNLIAAYDISFHVIILRIKLYVPRR